MLTDHAFGNRPPEVFCSTRDRGLRLPPRRRGAAAGVAFVVMACGASAQEVGFAGPFVIPVYTPGSQIHLSPLADLDGDGTVDFVTGKSAYLGLGDGGFHEEPIADEAVKVLSIADWDGDGLRDLLVIYPFRTFPSPAGLRRPSLQVRIQRERAGPGTLAFPVLLEFPITDCVDGSEDEMCFSGDGVFADVDADGVTDLVLVTSTWHEITDPSGFPMYRWWFFHAVARGLGGGALGEFRYYRVGTTPGYPEWASDRYPGQPVPADLDGDGLPDLASPVPGGSHGVWAAVTLNDGEGGFLRSAFYDVYAGFSPPVIGFPDPLTLNPADVDLDGDLDLLAGDGGAPCVFGWLENDGSGRFVPRAAPAKHYSWTDRPYPLCPLTVEVRASDLDRDGRMDAVTLAPFRVSVVWDFVSPERRLETEILDMHLDRDGALQLRLGDLNADGVDDILVNGLGSAASEAPCNARILLSRAGGTFTRGDADFDGRANLSDAVKILEHLFHGGDAALDRCLDAGDSDDSGTLNITDAIYLLAHLFLGGAAPSPPYPEPGGDPTSDGHLCER